MPLLITRHALLLLLSLLLPTGTAFAGLLDSLSGKLGIGQQDGEFLKVERAFIFSADSADSRTLVARWDIADGYYLYRDKFRFELIDAPDGMTPGQPQFPSGKVKYDEYFGEMEVYYGSVEIRIPVAGRNDTALPQDLTLKAYYQGCADAGFCYPPHDTTTTLRLPAGGSGSGAVQDEGFVSEQVRYARSLAGGNLLWTLLGFFGIGLLLSFTPCVLPMFPILSGILIGQGQQVTPRHGFFISLAYVLPMAVTYAIAGVLAGLFGQNLQIIFQNPWIISGFSLIFVLLALAMFGFYELQLPSRWQGRLNDISNHQRRGSYTGAAVMGFLSALIVGPCVAAPLAGILIYIGMSGDAVIGGLALLIMGMGMGTPLLLLGASAGKLLPRVGPWMDNIKRLFGIMLLGLAIWMLERIAPVQLTLLLWAALLITSAVFIGALDRLQPEATRWSKLGKALGLMMMLWGALLVVGAASGAKTVLRPLEGLSQSNVAGIPEHGLAFRQVRGIDGLQQALANAGGRPVMLDFYADWCVECKRMERNTFTDPTVQGLLANMLLLQTDVTANDEIDQALLARYDLIGPPALLFFDENGRELVPWRLIGYMDAERFARHLRRALQAGG